MSDERADRRSYDLYMLLGAGRIAWTSIDHGVTLDDEHIAWNTGDKESKARLRDIAEVHLETSSCEEETIARCRIRFADGSTVTIVNGNKLGSEDDAFADVYVEFVRDLHQRLLMLEGASIAFTAGFSEGRHLAVKVVMVVAGLCVVVTPAIVLLITGTLNLVFTLCAGVGLVWPLYKMVQGNAPRSYDPRAIPEGLIETRSRRSGGLSWMRN
jgi:hypothetical protein